MYHSISSRNRIHQPATPAQQQGSACHTCHPSAAENSDPSVRPSVRACVRACVHGCVCVRAQSIYIYIHTYVFVSACAQDCMWPRIWMLPSKQNMNHNIRMLTSVLPKGQTKHRWMFCTMRTRTRAHTHRHTHTHMRRLWKGVSHVCSESTRAILAVQPRPSYSYTSLPHATCICQCARCMAWESFARCVCVTHTHTHTLQGRSMSTKAQQGQACPPTYR